MEHKMNYRLLFKQMKLKDAIGMVNETQHHALGIIYIPEEVRKKMNDIVMDALKEVCELYAKNRIYNGILNAEQLETLVRDYEFKYDTKPYIGCVHTMSSSCPKVSIFCPSSGTGWSLKAELFSKYWDLIDTILIDIFHIGKDMTRYFYEKMSRRIVINDDLLDTIVFIPLDEILEDLFK